jgi:hypothetical protein
VTPDDAARQATSSGPTCRWPTRAGEGGDGGSPYLCRT